MSIAEAVILGIVQGLTEFLPISSSAHLIVLPWLLGWEEPGLAFGVALHMGTLLAVLTYFWRDLIGMAVAVPQGIVRREPFKDPMSRLGFIIVLGSIPAAIVGWTLEGQIDTFFHTGGGGNTAIALIACTLMALAVLLWVAERVAAHRRPMTALTARDGILIGLAQALALIPGVSRSGSTITAGLFTGLQREAAARFSFLLGIPAIAGAGALEAKRILDNGLPRDERLAFAVGIVAAAVVGYLAIAFLLRYLRTRSTVVFIVYRFGLGLFLLGLLATGLR